MPIPHCPREVSRLRLAVLRLARRLRQNAPYALSPSQQSILVVLDSYGPVTLGRLAEIEAVQPPSITRLVGQLEEAGLVVRSQVADNLRQVEVRLTEAGVEAAAAVHVSRDEWLAEIVDRLPPERKQRLRDVVDTLEELLADGAPGGSPK